jgi:hypothetical protein
MAYNVAFNSLISVFFSMNPTKLTQEFNKVARNFLWTSQEMHFAVKIFSIFIIPLAKSRVIPVTGRASPWGCETSRTTEFINNRLTVGGEFLALSAGHLLPPRKIPGIHFCYRLSRLEGLDQLKIPMTSSAIEPATFQFVA